MGAWEQAWAQHGAPGGPRVQAGCSSQGYTGAGRLRSDVGPMWLRGFGGLETRSMDDAVAWPRQAVA